MITWNQIIDIIKLKISIIINNNIKNLDFKSNENIRYVKNKIIKKIIKDV